MQSETQGMKGRVRSARRLKAGFVVITGLWLRRSGNKTEVLFEHRGRWRVAITEFRDGSHDNIGVYITGRAMRDANICPEDPVTRGRMVQ